MEATGTVGLMTKRQLRYYNKLKSLVESKGGNLLDSYTRSTIPVRVRCSEGHVFSKTPNYLNNGGWCAECGPKKKAARESMNQRLREMEYTALSPYISYHSAVAVRCSAGHTFNVTPAQIYSGKRCPECPSGKQVQIRDRLANVVASRGGKLAQCPPRSTEPVTIQCQNGHNFVRSRYSILNGAWCDKCSHRQTVSGEKAFIEKVSERGGNVLGIYTSHIDAVHLQCSKGHAFFLSPRQLREGQWCRHCPSAIYERTKSKLIAIIKERGGTLVECPRNSSSKVTIRCDKGHEFKSSRYTIINGSWCRKCSYNSRETGEASLKERVAEYGGVLLSQYQSGGVKVKIQCDRGHIFERTPGNLKTVGRFCPICKESHGENKVRRILEFLGVEYKQAVKVSKYKFSFHVPELNLLIDYDERKHFSYIKTFHREHGDFLAMQASNREKVSVATALGYNVAKISHNLYYELESAIRDILASDRKVYMVPGCDYQWMINPSS